MQLAGSEDGGWVYTERDAAVQNGNSGCYVRSLAPIWMVTGESADCLTPALARLLAHILNTSAAEAWTQAADR